MERNTGFEYLRKENDQLKLEKEKVEAEKDQLKLEDTKRVNQIKIAEGREMAKVVARDKNKEHDLKRQDKRFSSAKENYSHNSSGRSTTKKSISDGSLNIRQKHF